MKKINHFGDVLRKREAKETKDKIEIIEGKKYSLYFLYDGVEGEINSNRAISAASKFIKNSFSYYQEKNKVNLKSLLFDANKKIIELNISNAHTGVLALYVPKNESDKSIFVIVGSPALYTSSYNQLVRINNKKADKLLGHNRIKKDDFQEIVINNEKAPIFLCSDGFINLLAQKRKDIVKILNQKDAGSSRASMMRIMKARNFDDLAYLYIRK